MGRDDFGGCAAIIALFAFVSVYIVRFGDMLFSTWLLPRFPEIMWGVWGAAIGATAGLHVVDRKLDTRRLSRILIYALSAAMLILAVCGQILRR